ncbi:MAG: hypothetical protein PVF15_06525 [Candidatus Bathyarchaeota archaeon]|jgi:threonine/homoserine/homoserine lactone efflux protein
MRKSILGIAILVAGLFLGLLVVVSMITLSAEGQLAENSTAFFILGSFAVIFILYGGKEIYRKREENETI